MYSQYISFDLLKYFTEVGGWGPVLHFTLYTAVLHRNRIGVLYMSTEAVLEGSAVLCSPQKLYWRP